VLEMWVRPSGEEVEIGVRGTAFLRHMVRIVVGTLVEVGKGRRAPDCVAHALASRRREDAGVTAPPQGLFLREVRYEVPVLETAP